MAPAPRRSALLQTRSQDTRRKLIRTALQLWDERGFEESFEAITAEEIARAAGVSKGTFYFHFAHKEDVLLEMSWATAARMDEESHAAMERSEDTFELSEQVMASLARRVGRAPRPAVLRVTAHWSRLAHTGAPPSNHHSFRQAWRDIVVYARGRGDLPGDVDEDELAALLQAATMDALVAYASTAQSAATLRKSLVRRAELILRGAATATWA